MRPEEDGRGQHADQQQSGKGVDHNVAHHTTGRAAGLIVRHATEPTDARIFGLRRFSPVLYLLLILIVIGLTYVVMRTVRANAQRPTTRVIGPDDDPEFLWKIGRGTTPRTDLVARGL